MKRKSGGVLYEGQEKVETCDQDENSEGNVPSHLTVTIGDGHHQVVVVLYPTVASQQAATIPFTCDNVIISLQ